MAAVLFGLSTPLAKPLVAGAPPVLVAGLLYLGSGLGLFAWRRVRRAPAVRLSGTSWGWLAAAVGCGGLLAPPLLLAGLTGLAAAPASLLLNAEAVFTALIAWVVFRENVDTRVALGFAAIVAGGLVLAWPGGSAGSVAVGPTLLVLAACALWALDNNLTRRVAEVDATWLAMVKGLAAGGTNTALALAGGARTGPVASVAVTLLIGLFCYGVSLSLFVVALRHLGVARTGAYFSTAPFVGSVAAVVLWSEPVTWRLLVAGSLMALGVWLHLTERHEHRHRHEALTHDHLHDHADGHHDHEHPPGTPPGPHRHRHTHTPVVHSHPHYPDLHHRHRHGHGSPGGDGPVGA
ncbi:MAG: DMT family transporter [Micropruina sp.]|nr:MAG: DMT family transporter [Micropruina sp.]